MSTGTIWSRWRVVDRERLLARLDAMDGYLAELRAVAPARPCAG
jgi:hypothetical protein